MRSIQKPIPGEYPTYADMYMKLVPADGHVLEHLNINFISTKNLVLSIPTEKLNFRYANGKWTIKEILLHIIDDERIYAYRALRFARNDETELPGFEQDAFAKFSGANERDIRNLLDEFESVRRATITLFDNLPEEALTRKGVADGKQSTVRALAYHIAGHELHHVNIIKEKYI